jgi:hypothetical protein
MYGCSGFLRHCPADDVTQMRIRMPSDFLFMLVPDDVILLMK